MLAVVGAIPDPDLPLLAGPAKLMGRGQGIEVQGRSIDVNRGSAALVASALAACPVLNCDGVFAFLVGDIGLGDGSRKLYHYLTENLAQHRFSALAFHYLQPDADWQCKVLFAAESMVPEPILVADAGFMYAAKMGGQAPSYDLFTPDAGELAFLADEKAPHPFYTRGFILHQGNDTRELIARAFEHGNAARHLLVKGSQDFMANGPDDIIELKGPRHPAMEAIGGTGDTLTGLASILAAGGMPLARAARVAALANRLAGLAADPTPATQIAEIINQLPGALEQALAQEKP